MTQVRRDVAPVDIMIAGGGAVGLTLATALGQKGYAATLIDANPPTGADPRAWFIASGCWRMFRALGLADELDKVSEPVVSVEADAPGGGVAFLAEEAAQRGDSGAQAELGRMILADKLIPVLTAAAHAAGVTIVEGRVAAPTFGDPRAEAQVGGELMGASLIVACDGARSVLRDTAGIRFEGRDHSTRAVSTLLELTAPHEGRARQHFLRTGPIAVLPLPGGEGRLVNLVWTVPAAIADALIALDDKSFGAELAHQAHEFAPGARLAGPRVAFPTGVRIADRFHAPRLALAGDSAHVVHPLAGQGLNLGLKDAAALVDVIETAARAGLDIGSEAALAPYTRWRRADVTAMAGVMEAFAATFTAPKPVRLAAGAAMQAAGSANLVRRMFAREAGGELGDVPSLMRAE